MIIPAARTDIKAATPARASQQAEITQFGAAWTIIRRELLTRVKNRTIVMSTIVLAVFAGVGAGVYRDLWDGQRIVGEPSSSDAPDPANRAACEELYARYCALREEVLK